MIHSDAIFLHLNFTFGTNVTLTRKCKNLQMSHNISNSNVSYQIVNPVRVGFCDVSTWNPFSTACWFHIQLQRSKQKYLLLH